MKRPVRRGPVSPLPSSLSGFRFPPEVILLAVRWYLRYSLSYRDLEGHLAERGIDVDQVTLFRWVQRFTPELIDAARPGRHVAGDRWFVDETYVKVAGIWRYVYRAVDQYGQVIDVYLSDHRDIAAARTFFTAALAAHAKPAEVVTDRAAPLAHLIDDLLPESLHTTEQYANNRVECDHGRLKARLRPMRGLKTNGERADPRSRLRAEPAPRALRTRNRHHTRARVGNRLRRTPGSDLAATPCRREPSRPAIDQRDRADRSQPGGGFGLGEHHRTMPATTKPTASLRPPVRAPRQQRSWPPRREGTDQPRHCNPTPIWRMSSARVRDALPVGMGERRSWPSSVELRPTARPPGRRPRSPAGA